MLGCRERGKRLSTGAVERPQMVVKLDQMADFTTI